MQIQILKYKKINLQKSILYYSIIREETREKILLTITLTIYLDRQNQIDVIDATSTSN
jgi:hypothetical protein